VWSRPHKADELDEGDRAEASFEAPLQRARALRHRTLAAAMRGSGEDCPGRARG
jgi:hypothetical protein